MLDLVKALIALRLVAYFAPFIVVLAPLGIWTLSRGSTAGGIAILAADVTGTTALGHAVARRTTRRSH
jgi:hypothetical protein